MTKQSFYWGVSTSAFQVEGGFNEGGKGLATTDVRKVPDGLANTHVASDHFHHYEEDIKLMKELGVNLYRFSFSWSRIMPDGHAVNQEGLAFYHQVIDLCLSYGITPFPTLYHFEMPQALVDEYGGWRSRKCIDDYVHYATVCFEAFKNKVFLWGTINEQLVVTGAPELTGNNADNTKDMLIGTYQMSYHMSVAEAKAIECLRSTIPKAKVATISATQNIYPLTSKPEDVLAAMDAEELTMYMFLDMSVYGEYSPRLQYLLKRDGLFPVMQDEDQLVLKNNCPDFIGVNYYCSGCVKENESRDIPITGIPFTRSSAYTMVVNPELSPTEWMASGIDPIGLRTVLYKLFNRYHLPMLITENGMAYSEEMVDGMIEDDYRIDYLEKHIEQVLIAKEEGYPILGYSPWSFIDSVSSHQGFKKRYGLVYVNRTDRDIKDCMRYPKKSYYWYQNMIKEDINCDKIIG